MSIFQIWLIGVVVSFGHTIVMGIINHKKLKAITKKVVEKEGWKVENIMLATSAIVVVTAFSWPITIPFKLIYWFLKKIAMETPHENK